MIRFSANSVLETATSRLKSLTSAASKLDFRTSARSIWLAALFAPTLALFLTPVAHADGLMQDFDSLGGNDVLLDRARALNPESRVSVVQNRVVDTRGRFEFAPEYSSVVSGDPYNLTQNFGVNAQYHINPYWSVGLKYNYAINQLTGQAEADIDNAKITGKAQIPDIDYPKQELMGIVNWYPIYGKMNLHELGIVHFDIYALGGAGGIELRSGNVMSYTAGGGIGFWVSQHVTTRVEVRYQTYEATHFDGQARMNTTVAGLQVGYLL